MMDEKHPGYEQSQRNDAEQQSAIDQRIARRALGVPEVLVPRSMRLLRCDRHPPLIVLDASVWDGAEHEAKAKELAMTERTWVDVRRDQRGVAVVAINNPAKLNTLNTPVMTDLIAAAEELAGDRDLRAVVLRGTGDRAFIGGADIREMAGLDAASARTFITMVHRSCDVFRRLPVPVIARIEGWTLGAGLEVAAACDMRVAATGARFGMPEVRVGLPSVVEAALLPGLIGWGRTRRLLLTGETIDAATALAWGLIDEAVPADELDTATERLVIAILASGPRAVRLQKVLIDDWQAMAVDAAIQHGIDGFVDAWATDEPRRMLEAFLQRPR